MPVENLRTRGDLVTLPMLLAHRARHDGDRDAYTFMSDGETISGQLSFARLDHEARSIAAVLRKLTGKGERALLLYPPGLEFVKAFWACLYAGIVAVPLYPPRTNRPDRRIPDVARDARATIALSTAEIVTALQHRSEDLGSLPDQIKYCATDAICSTEHFCDESISGDSVCFLQYTSGSTSSPKGVMVSHGNLLENLDNLHEGWRHTPESVMVTWLPTFHDMGLIYGVLQPVFNGFSCYAMPPNAFFQRPLRWLQAITRFRGTHSAAPNFAFDHCVESISPEELGKLDLSSWQVALNGAEPVRESTQRRFAEYFAPCGFREVTFCPGYGLAEATLKVSATHIGSPVATCRLDAGCLAEGRVVESESADACTVVGCGPPSGSNRIAIVDPGTCTECPAGRVGEIWVSGPTVAQGYWNRPRETAETFQASLANDGDARFLRTGDLGFLHEGNLYVTGRIKDVIILQGLNFYPQDIERTVELCHPALHPTSCAAFGVDVAEEERLVVVQEVERSWMRSMDADEVIDAIRRAVSDEHSLSLHAVALLRPASILKTSSGKIQRRACRDAFLRGELQVLTQWQARTDTEKRGEVLKELQNLEPDERAAHLVRYIRPFVATLLNTRADRISPRDRFTDLGVESIQAVEIQSHLSDSLGISLPSTLIFDYPTLEALATFIDRELFPPSARSAERPVDADPLQLLEDLSDDEVADLLAKELGGN